MVYNCSIGKALPIAIDKAGLNSNDIDYYELNEAFSVVGLVI